VQVGTTLHACFTSSDQSLGNNGDAKMQFRGTLIMRGNCRASSSSRTRDQTFQRRHVDRQVQVVDSKVSKVIDSLTFLPEARNERRVRGSKSNTARAWPAPSRARTGLPLFQPSQCKVNCSVRCVPACPSQPVSSTRSSHKVDSVGQESPCISPLDALHLPTFATTIQSANVRFQ